MSSPDPFDLFVEERTVLVIDGPNFFSAAKGVGIDVDYRKLREHFSDHSDFARAYYYTAMPDERDGEFNALRPLVDFLGFNGYTMTTKPTKEYTDHQTGQKRTKGNMTVEIAVDMLNMANWEGNLRPKHIVLFSGDGDFTPLVKAVQDRGIRVSVVSTAKPAPMISDDLRKTADNFVEISTDTFKQLFGRAPRADNRVGDRARDFEDRASR